MQKFEGWFIYKKIEYYICLFKIKSDTDYYVLAVQNPELDINTGCFFRSNSYYLKEIIRAGFRKLDMYLGVI